MNPKTVLSRITAALLPWMLSCAGGGAVTQRREPATPAEAEQQQIQQGVQQERVEEIERICSRKAASTVPRCWALEYEAAKDKVAARKLEAQITLMIIVAPDGRAQEIKVVGRSGGGGKSLEDCLVEEARSWGYPEGKVAAPVYCSFYLKSSM